MNGLKTTILLGVLTAIFLLIGRYIGGQTGMFYALVFSVLFNFGTYWFSDKIVLSMYGAKPVTETEVPELYSIVRELASGAGIPLPKVYMVDMPAPNAFATGRNPEHAAVAVSPSIMRLLTREELRAVLGHELSHVKNRDILVSTIAASLAGAISYLAQMAYFFGGMQGDERNRENSSPIVGLLIMILAPLAATLVHLAVSRGREYIADESGAKLTRDAESLATALLKIQGYATANPSLASPREEATAHLFFINPFKLGVMTSLFSTHPPTEERVRRLRSMQV